jgi:hypothetical protein
MMDDGRRVNVPCSINGDDALSSSIQASIDDEAAYSEGKSTNKNTYIGLALASISHCYFRSSRNIGTAMLSTGGTKAAFF